MTTIERGFAWFAASFAIAGTLHGSNLSKDPLADFMAFVAFVTCLVMGMIVSCKGLKEIEKKR